MPRFPVSRSPVLRWTLPRCAAWLVALLAHVSAGAAPAAAPLHIPETRIPEDLFDELAYRYVGPVGNRVTAVTGEPGNPNVDYAGAASGGIFKTTDAGAHWEPIFDDTPAASIGALAVAPSDPNVVWAGTGETFLRANVSIGDGIYRSTDGGKTWQHRGLEKTGRIARVVIHPHNPDVVYVAALGHAYGPQQERGVYRTTDGGATWQRVLFVDENTGASDLVMDPTNPRILFAGMWQIEINTWSRRSGGPGSSLWRSRDGGDTWTRLEDHGLSDRLPADKKLEGKALEGLEGEGLPKPPWGKIGLAMSADDPRRVYALIETSSNRDFAPLGPDDEVQGVLWRSDDGGDTWSRVSSDNNLVQRPLYYSRAAVAPDDRDEIYFMSVDHWTSLDGGKTAFKTASQPGWDHHDMWIDPEIPDRMIVGHDGGVSISTDRGRSWLRPQLPIAQMYHVAVDHRVPYFLYGNRQDGSTFRGPSNTLTGEEIPIGAWSPVGGCETGFSIPDPVHTDIVWSGCYDGLLSRHDLATGLDRDVSVWPESIESHAASRMRYRFQWTFPIAIAQHPPERVLVGSQFVHRTTDGGESWQVISPDLTTDDPELQRRTGGLTLDDASPTVAPTIFALAVSPLDDDEIWAGTNDGQVQLTRDGGASWTNLTAALPELPPRGTVSNLEPSRHAAGTAYLSVDRHQLGDTDPYLYKTADWGAHWTAIRSDLPRSVFSYVHCVREDPVRPGLLYAGTENGVWVSFDDGRHWHSLQSNLPPAPVHWLVVQEDFDDLVVATYGRGFWILDDLTPLRALAAHLPGDQPLLFAPRPAYRFRLREAPASQPEDPAAGHNPPYGASLHYYLPEGPKTPTPTKPGKTDEPAAGQSVEPSIELAILDASGEPVFSFEKIDTRPGLHRVYWDLRYDKTPEVKLRTKPDENPRVPIPDKGWRELSDGGRFALLAPPGAYTVRLTVGEGDDAAVSTRTLAVRPDPVSDARQIAEQMEVLTDLRARITDAARMIQEIEWLRRQLEDLVARLEDSDRDDVEELTAAATDLETELEELEGRFFDLRLTGAEQDTLRWQRLLYARMVYLAQAIGGSDFPPTTQQREVYERLGQRMDEARQRFAELEQTGVAAFNARLREAGVGALVTGLKP